MGFDALPSRIAVLSAFVLLTGCVPVVESAEIVSSTASHVIVVSDEVVRQKPSAQREHFIRSRERRGLPRRVNVWSEQAYWVVPICNNVIRMDLGGPYQLQRGSPFPIECR